MLEKPDSSNLALATIAILGQAPSIAGMGVFTKTIMRCCVSATASFASRQLKTLAFLPTGARMLVKQMLSLLGLSRRSPGFTNDVPRTADSPTASVRRQS